MPSRADLAWTVALAVGLPLLAALVAGIVVLSEASVAGVAIVLVVPGAVAAGLAVFVVLRHDERVRAALEEAERERIDFRRAVARLGDTLAATRDLTRLSEVALHEAVATVRAQGGAFFSVSPARMQIQARAAFAGHPIGDLPWGSGVAGAVAAWGRAALAPRDVLAEPPEPTCDTAAAVPLFSRGAIFGVLAVYGHEGADEFDEDTLETLLALARHTEAAIDNVYLQEETRRLSITDGLTGLWNRRELELRCRQEFERATRFGRPFAVLLADVDRFKEINDTLGHHAGDSVLVDLAGRLSAATREIDTVARYGGDEFALLLPETGPDGASAVAEKIRKVVKAEDFEFEGHGFSATVSIGVAGFPETGDSARGVLVVADEALYRAKRAGRDRVATASGVVSGGGDDESGAGGASDATGPDETEDGEGGLGAAGEAR